MSDQSHARAFWLPAVGDPAAPTAEEIAAAVPLGVVVDDGLRFDEDFPRFSVVVAPDGRRYRVIRRSRVVDVILLSEPGRSEARP